MGSIESGAFEHESQGSIPAVRRAMSEAPFWARPVAWILARRERNALIALSGEARVPALLEWRGSHLLRSYIEGQPLHEARPTDPRFYDDARRLLRRIHRLGVTHNDTHKEANWLVTPEGLPALVDFQLASRHRGRGGWFQLCRLEDVRHLLKHKRTYCPAALKARERALLARRSWVASWWKRWVKPAYRLVTRRVLRWRDDEGKG